MANMDIKEYGVPSRFNQFNQPPLASRAKGWAKRKRNRELIQALMEQPFIGDPNLRAEMASYFNCNEADVTNELMILFAQVGKAIQKGDLQAAQLVLERAYGKPKESATIETQITIKISRGGDNPEVEQTP